MIELLFEWPFQKVNHVSRKIHSAAFKLMAQSEK